MRVDNDPKVAMTNTSVWSFVRTSNSFPPIVRAGCGALLRRTCGASLQSAVHDQGRRGLDKQRAYNIYLLDGWRRCRSICEPGQHVEHASGSPAYVSGRLQQYLAVMGKVIDASHAQARSAEDQIQCSLCR